MIAKAKYILTVFFLMQLLGGCIKEDSGECPPPGSSLLFRYTGNGETDIFDSRIDNIGMYIYDSEGNIVMTENLSRERLEQYRGTELRLDPGRYRVVCWGNIARYSALGGQEKITSGRLYQADWIKGDVISDFDSLYYGTKSINILPRNNPTDTLDFVSAHINMEVHIRGYGTLPVRATGQGLIELDNVSVGYDFAMELRPETSVMYPVWSDDREPGIISSRFNLLRFFNDTDMVLRVRGVDGIVKAEISIAEFLSEHDIDVEGINEVTIPIYITFDGHELQVTVDGWHTIPVDPT